MKLPEPRKALISAAILAVGALVLAEICWGVVSLALSPAI